MPWAQQYTPAGSLWLSALAAALTIYWMVELSMPISTSQAIVGAIIGWNFFAGKETDIAVLGKIVSTWIICPILSGGIAIALYYLVRLIIKHSKMHLIRQDLYTRIGLILVGAFGAYALGANNIANVMGVFVDSSPLKPITFSNGFTLNATQILFLIGGISISIGVATYSHKVINTVGINLMSMTPIIAWIVVISQSIVLFIFASQGLQALLQNNSLPSIPLVPVSSSQAVIGAVIGIGIAKGGRDIHWPLLGKIAVGWITTPLFSGILCFISLFFLENVFNQVVYAD